MFKVFDLTKDIFIFVLLCKTLFRITQCFCKLRVTILLKLNWAYTVLVRSSSPGVPKVRPLSGLKNLLFWGTSAKNPTAGKDL